MTQTDSAPVSGAVIVGVDTHKDVHVAVALDVQGRRLGCCSVPTTSAGLLQLEQWSIRYGTVEVWGVEGTGSYGAGLTRQLVGHVHRVREVSRPERRVRRDKGKSDLIDAGCHVVCVNNSMEVSTDDGCCGITTCDAGGVGAGV